MSVLRLSLLSSISNVLCFQKTFKGQETQLPLPLENEATTNIKMEMKYWSTLKETKECVLDPYECTLDEYDTFLEGDISLKNVDTTAWKDDKSDTVQILLAFDQTTVPDVFVYDVLTFQYTWDPAKVSQTGGWTCVDGNIPKGSTKPDIKTDTVSVDAE